MKQLLRSRLCGKKEKKRIINIYRSFNPTGETAKDLFTKQLNVIKNAFNTNTVIMGDFNIDFKKKFDVNYQRKDYFELFDIYYLPVRYQMDVKYFRL